MYLPRAFANDDPAALRAFVLGFPFATLVTPVKDELFVSHLPLIWNPATGPIAELIGHLARANPHAAAIDGAGESLAIFHGPHAYISPTMYAEPLNVPTWNYAVAHLHGRLEPVTDPTAARQILDQLTGHFERGRAAPWPGELPEDFRLRLEGGIVAFRMPVARWALKFKLGQNRSPNDRGRMIDTLAQSDDPAERALVAFLRSVDPGGDRGGRDEGGGVE